MKNLVTVFLLMLLFNAAKSQNLTVATYNLRGDDPSDVGNEWTNRKLMVTDQIEKYKFDIVALEETNANMAGYLIANVPRMDTVGRFTDIGTGIMFNSDRLQLLAHSYFWLSATPDVESKGWDAKFKRICVWAKFKDLITGLEFYTFGTHFDHVGTVARTNSVALVIQRINSIAGTAPTIFLGDMNISQYDPNYITLNNSTLLKDTKNLAVINHEKERGSGNGFDINRRDRTRVDHIFVTNTWQAYQNDVLLDLYNGHTTSDHYAVMAVIGQKANNLGDMYREFPEDFENPNPVKSSYTNGDVIFRTGTWALNAAIIGGSSSNDKPTSGAYGVRMVNGNTTSAYLQMNFDVTDGASKVVIEHSTYDMDSVSKWQLEYSRNQGLSWVATGPVIATHQLNKQQAIFIMDIPGTVRFRINKLGISASDNGRLDIDDFTIYKRKNPGQEKQSEPLLAWQFATPASTGREVSANASLNNPALNTSTLTRGAGFRTTTSTSSTIGLPGGFAAAATIASTLFASDTTIAISNNLYFQFAVNPKASQKVSLSTIDAKLMSTGPTLKLWYWKYSLDGVNYKFLAKSYLFNSATSTAQATVDLSVYPELQNITSDKTVYFRLYVNGTDAAAEILGFGVSNPSTANDYVLSVGGIVEDALPTSKLVAWQFYSPATTGAEVGKTASIINSAVTATQLTRGAGLPQTNSYYPTPILLSRAFSAVTSITSAATLADTTVAIANNMYFAYSVKVKPDFKLSLSSLEYKVRISGGGAKVWYWKYSLDSITFKKLANPVLLTGITDTEGATQPQLNLSGIPELQNIPAGTTIYFRLYTNGSNNTSGTTAIGRSTTATEYPIALNGTTKSVTATTPLAAWQFATPLRNGGELTATASLTNASVTAGVLERGAGLKAVDNTSGAPMVLSRTMVSVTAIPTTAAVIDTAKAVANNMYFSFNIGVQTGYKVSLSSLNYKIRISSGGAKVWYWKYSLDGINFEKISNPIVLSTFTADEGDVQPAVDVSGISALQNLPAGKAVYFRLYTNGSNTTTGTTAIGRSATGTSTDYVLVVNGNAEAVIAPEKLVAWQFATPQKAGSEANITATTINSAVNATALVRGAGFTASGLARSFASIASVASSTDITDTVTAITNNIYYGFSLSAKTGKVMHLKGLDYKLRASGGGAKVYYWKYSFNGTNFFKIENPQTLAITTNGEGEFMPHVDLSGIDALQNIHAGTTVYFRLYANGSNLLSGSTSIGRSTAATTEDVLWVSGNWETEILPIQLIAFGGKLNGKQTDLTWQTISEHNNSHFEVLRFQSGKNPIVIGKVEGSGQSSTLKKYGFVDFNPYPGTSYYQLRQIDFNGQANDSEVISIKNAWNENSFNIAVSKGQLELFAIADASGEADFMLTDIMGKVLIKKHIQLTEGSNAIIVPAYFQPGVYIGTLLKAGNEKISKKIIL